MGFTLEDVQQATSVQETNNGVTMLKTLQQDFHVGLALGWVALNPL
jgi:hypothetical protein